MTDIAPQPQQIALQNVNATTIRIGSIVQTINYVQRSQALSTTVNDRLPPVPDGDVWQVRNEERELGRLLTGAQCRLLGLYGAGGYGKSSTTAQVFKTVQGFGRKFWVNFQDPVDFGTFGRWMIRQFLGDDRYEQNRELYERCNDAELVNEVLSRLLAENCLLVLDNLETLFQDEALWSAYGEFLNGWLLGNGGGYLVLTSQFRLDLPMATVWEWIGLRGLELAQGVALLRAEQIVGEVAHLEAFVREADGHPLLLTLAVNLLKRREKDDFESPEILRLGQGDVELLREIREAHRGDSEASVGKVLDLSFERLYPEWLRVLLWRSSVLRGQFGLAAAQAMIPDESVTLPEMRKLARWSFLLEQRQGEEWQFDILPLIRRYLKLGAKVSGNLHFAHEAAIEYYSENYQEWDGTLESCCEELEAFYHACELGQYGRANEILDRCFKLLDLAGKYRSLLPLCVRLTDEWKPIDDDEAKNLGWAWIQSGNLYQNLGNYLKAIDSHHQAQSIFDRLNFNEGKAASLGNLGNAYNSLGQCQCAIDFYQQSLELNRELENREGEADSLCDLGNAYASLGRQQYEMGDNEYLEQYKKAMKLYLESLPIQYEVGNQRNEANVLCGIGDIHNFFGQYEQALEFHKRDHAISCEIDDINSKGRSLFNMALSLYNLDKQNEALLLLEKAKIIYEECELDHMVERCNDAIRNCNQIIAAERISPPPIDQPPKESAIEGSDRKKQANQPIVRNTEDDRKMNRIFYFCVGLAICFVVWKVKN